MGLEVSELAVEVTEAENPIAALLMAHGAGASMDHWFMEEVAERLALNGLTVLRFNFTYMSQGRRRPDHRTRLLADVDVALDWAQHVADTLALPLFAGGKSMGGRMISTFLSLKSLPAVRGLVFFGFPLHPAGKEGVKRAEHLADVEIPMFFLQGTRDRLANMELLRPVVDDLGSGANLHVVEGADHGFEVLKRSGRKREDVWDELALEARRWVDLRLGVDAASNAAFGAASQEGSQRRL